MAIVEDLSTAQILQTLRWSQPCPITSLWSFGQLTWVSPEDPGTGGPGLGIHPVTSLSPTAGNPGAPAALSTFLHI